MPEDDPKLTTTGPTEKCIPEKDGTVEGTPGNDKIDLAYMGDPERDRIDNNDGTNGTTGNEDLVMAGAGDDTVKSGLEDDTIFAGSGDDTVQAESGDDTVFGESGDDSISGGQGDDTLYGDGTGEEPVNLIVNGSFEDVTGLETTGYGFRGDGAIPGWTSSDPDGTIDVHNDDRGFVQPTDGENWLDLAESPGDIRIGQDVSGVEDGKLYTLTFDAGDIDLQNNTFEVYWGGELVAAIDPPDGPDPMETYSFTVVGGAGDGSDRLEFRGIDDDDTPDNFGASIDNVSLVAAGATGGEGDDTIEGNSGDDEIFGGEGDDDLSGGAGEDEVSGGGGTDDIDLGSGDDTVTSGDGEDDIDGGEGTDTYDALNGDDPDLTVTVDVDLSGTGTVTKDDGDDIETDTVAGIENFVAPESPAEADQITINEPVTAADLSGIDTIAAIGNFAPESGDPATLFGGAGEPTLQDLLDTNLPGTFTITDGDESGKIGDISFENFETIIFSVEAGPDGTVNGTEGNDTITLTGGPGGGVFVDAQGDSVDGDDGIDDIILAEGGDDVINGGLGDDTIDAGSGDDFVLGSSGDDTIDGGEGDDDISGGEGDDDISSGPGNDDVDGNSGDDTIDTRGEDPDAAPDLGFGDPGDAFYVEPDTDPLDDIDTVSGGAGDDTIFTGDDADVIDGDSGDDVIDGGNDIDQIDGGQGDDTILGGEGSDTIDGGSGDDFIAGGLNIEAANIPDDSLIFPDPEPDNGDDVLSGGAGNDTILGEDDDDTIFGDSGDDVIDGGIDQDTISGGSGDDTIIQSSGEDILAGDEGFDTLSGERISDGGGSISVEVDNDGDGTSTDDEGDTDPFTSIENFVGGENGEVDDVTFTTTANVADVSGFDDNSVGTFTPSNGSDPIAFGGPGEPALSEILGGTYIRPGEDDPVNPFGQVNITSGDESGTVGDVSVENFEDITFDIICFVRGTMIETDRGEVAVEDLAEGDMIRTLDNGFQPLRWVGASKVEAQGRLAPVVIREGAIGNSRDLRVSPQHRVLVRGWQAELLFGEREVLTSAKSLVNDRTIFRLEGGEVEYFHILFDAHQIVFSEGAPTESFHPGKYSLDGLGEASRREILELFPQLDGNAMSYGPSARLSLKAKEAKILAENPDFLIS